MRHGSLFSGIGGFDLAASWMGWSNVFHCEKDAFCRRILKYYWPEALCYEDIREFDGKGFVGAIDILTGGFPCQPFSVAGHRRGTDDERHLWPEMCRVICEIRPRWVVGENVLGLINWSGGLVFEQVQADLEALGYEVWSFVLPAACVGAPHRRDRVWIIAYAGSGGFVGISNFSQFCDDLAGERTNTAYDTYKLDDNGNTSRTITSPVYGAQFYKGGNFETKEAPGDFEAACVRRSWERFPVESPVCNRDDGFPGFLDGISFSSWREKALRGVGNAIVPQVAYRIFQTIGEFEKMRSL